MACLYDKVRQFIAIAQPSEHIAGAPVPGAIEIGRRNKTLVPLHVLSILVWPGLETYQDRRARVQSKVFQFDGYEKVITEGFRFSYEVHHRLVFTLVVNLEAFDLRVRSIENECQQHHKIHGDDCFVAPRDRFDECFEKSRCEMPNDNAE